MILDLDVLGKTIVDRDIRGKWEEDYAVVTEIVAADLATILISSARDANIDLRAGADFDPAGFSLASLQAGLTVVNSRKIQTKIIGESGLTPLFKARKIKTTFLGNVRFRNEPAFEELTYEKVV